MSREIITMRDICNEKITMQVLRLSCPKCLEPVQFVLQEEDKQYKNDNDYLSELNKTLNERIHTLEMILCRLGERT